MAPTNTTNNGSRQSVPSWLPATNKMAVKKDSFATPQPTEDDGEGVIMSSSASNPPPQPSPSPSSAPPSSAPPSSMQDEPKPKSNPHADETSLFRPEPMKGGWWGTSDASRCRHLEECMFPRFLSLDCKQMDEFCMGCVKDRPNRKNIGRIYMEALHLKDFLKSPEAIISPDNNAPSKGSGKRGRKNTESSKKKNRLSPSKRSSDKNDEQVTDNSRLSQAYFGGLEGKRTWFLANSHTTGKGGGVAGSYCQVLPSSILNVIGTEEDSNFTSGKNSKKGVPSSKLDNLLSSEVKLASLRKAMRLHDHTVPFDSSDDAHPELTSLKKLVKPLPGYTPPRILSGPLFSSYVETHEGCKVSNEEPAVPSATTDTPTSSPNIGSQSMKIDGKRNESAHRNKSNERTVPVLATSVAQETPLSSNGTLLKKGSPSSHSPKIEDREIISSTKRHAKLGNIPIKSHYHPESNFDRAMREGKEAALAANMMLESFRRNRRTFWAHKLNNGKAPKCAWCPSSSNCSAKAKTSSNFEFGVITENIASSKSEDYVPGATGDALIQCMECDLVGCTPRLINGEKSGNQHVMLHFLMSGHRFGVTCGPLGEIFCFGCGDNVYHECFDQERERLFLEQNIPSLCWRETPILRGIDPSSFIVTPENGVVWRGMMAAYPTPVSTQLVQASRFAAKRSSIFRGNIVDISMEMGVKAAELSVYQQCHLEDRWIPSPVGIYNLGNSCFMSATLQCMIHCKPLQELFLRDLAHPYQSCDSLRCGSNKTSCLTCEMDKTFVEYYGSAVGIDAIAALEEQLELSSDATPTRVKKQTPDNRGHPIVPSSLLAEIWKNRDVTYDAQEFFNAFVDCLATHALAYQKSAQEMRQIMLETQIKHSYSNNDLGAKSDTDFIRKIFMGTLRTVLICQKCGCKRTQTESFSNVSLPLAKEFPTTDTEARSSPRRGRISVRSVLDHFTRPETLADPVDCPSCNSKTKTLKQHTFSKLPEVLCLHLKRFDAAANKKIADFVAFPACGLDMGKYLPHWCERGLEVKDRNNGEHSAKSPKVLYDLFGTVNHTGTLHQGHYVANVKSGKRWYSCNDAFVTTAGEGDGEREVLSSAGAYMLFYIKK